MKFCKICEMESSEDSDKCEYCSAPFDISDEEVRAINRFFRNLVDNRRREFGMIGLRRDEAYFLYKMAPRVLGSCISEI